MKFYALAEKKPTLKKSLEVLILVATVFAIAALIATPLVTKFLPQTLLFNLATIVGAVAIGTWLIVFLGILFTAWLLQLTLVNLGAKGEYIHGLATLVYSTLPISIGMLLAAIFTYIPFVGSLLSFIAIAVFGVIGYALVYRLIIAYFKTDMITSFVAVTILTGVIILAIYIAGITFFGGLKAPFLV